MKQTLLILMSVALVGCGKKEAPKEENRVRVQRSTPKPEPPKAVPEKPIANTILEQLKKPTGELTNADLEKLTQLEDLYLGGNPNLTKAQIAELQKALPKCKIYSNPTK